MAALRRPAAQVAPRPRAPGWAPARIVPTRSARRPLRGARQAAGRPAAPGPAAWAAPRASARPASAGRRNSADPDAAPSAPGASRIPAPRSGESRRSVTSSTPSSGSPRRAAAARRTAEQDDDQQVQQHRQDHEAGQHRRLVAGGRGGAASGRALRDHGRWRVRVGGRPDPPAYPGDLPATSPPRSATVARGPPATMTEPTHWAFPRELQPKPGDVAFDLAAAFDAVVALRAEIPDDAATARSSAPSAPAAAWSSAPTAWC